VSFLFGGLNIFVPLFNKQFESNKKKKETDEERGKGIRMFAHERLK
jgi:hypothetical protein